MVDKEAIEKAVGEIIAGLGVLSPSNGLLDTPTRVAVAYEELFSGIDQDPSKELAASFEADPRRPGHGAAHALLFNV